MAFELEGNLSIEHAHTRRWVSIIAVVIPVAAFVLLAAWFIRAYIVPPTVAIHSPPMMADAPPPPPAVPKRAMVEAPKPPLPVAASPPPTVPQQAMAEAPRPSLPVAASPPPTVPQRAMVEAPRPSLPVAVAAPAETPVNEPPVKETPAPVFAADVCNAFGGATIAAQHVTGFRRFSPGYRTGSSADRGTDRTVRYGRRGWRDRTR